MPRLGNEGHGSNPSREPGSDREGKPCPGGVGEDVEAVEAECVRHRNYICGIIPPALGEAARLRRSARMQCRERTHGAKPG